MNATIVIPNGSSVIIEEPTIHLLASLVLPIISIVAVFFIGILSWKYIKKQHERTAMQYVFELLQQSGHKGAEKNIRDKYKDGKFYEVNDETDSSPAWIVERNYDQVGAMISNGVVPFKQYCISFGIITIVSYCLLKGLIENKRKEQKYYMANFTNLAIDCFEYWDNQKEELKPDIKDPKGEIITKQKLGKKITLPN